MSLILAVEDVLAETVSRKLISVVRPDLSVAVVMGLKGKTYLKAKARELNRTAASIPVFLLVDLDTPVPCPADLISNWLGGASQPRMLFRLAVMEIEAWILADRQRTAALLGIPSQRIPPSCDDIPKPNEFLVELARSGRHANVKQDIVPLPGSTATVGPAYNARLAAFVAQAWDPAEAAEASSSLAKSMRRLTELP